MSFDSKWYFRIFDVIRIKIKFLLTKLGLRTKQSCAYCGRDQWVIWTCSDYMWRNLPKKYHKTSLCLECFVNLHFGKKLWLDEIKIHGYITNDLMT